MMLGTMEKKTEFYLSDFMSLEKELAGREPEWLLSLRRDAVQQFSHLGFPTRKEEAWRFTNLGPVTKVPFLGSVGERAEVTRDQLDSIPFCDLGGPRVVFVDGFFVPELSDLGEMPEGVTVRNMGSRETVDLVKPHLGRHAAYKEQAFVALNTAFWRDGIYVEVARNTVVEKPLQVIFLVTGDEVARRYHPRNLVRDC